MRGRAVFFYNFVFMFSTAPTRGGVFFPSEGVAAVPTAAATPPPSALTTEPIYNRSSILGSLP